MSQTPVHPTVIIQHPQPSSKKFQIPSIDQVVISIKQLDQQIEHVSLNLIKCNFQATENDVRKAFPDYKDKFLKVKQYKPGSFQVVFQARMDAIEFTRNAPGKRILGRIFLVKLGRNYKNDKEDWVYVEAGGGNDKRRNQGQRGGRQYGQHGHQGNRNPRHEGEEKKEETVEEKKEETHKEKEKEKEHTQFKQQTVQEKKLQKKTIDSKYIKPIEKKEYKKDNREPRQFHHPQVKKEPIVAKTEEPVKEQLKPVETKQPQVKPAKETKPKVAEKEKEVPKKVEEKKDEDDGWVTVGKKGRR